MIIDSLISKTDNRKQSNMGSYSSQTHLASGFDTTAKYSNLGDEMEYNINNCGCNKQPSERPMRITDMDRTVHAEHTYDIPRPVPVNEYSSQYSTILFDPTSSNMDIPFPMNK